MPRITLDRIDPVTGLTTEEQATGCMNAHSYRDYAKAHGYTQHSATPGNKGGIKTMTLFRVSYPGFLQTVERFFYTLERAEQYARQVGKAKIATITTWPR